MAGIAGIQSNGKQKSVARMLDALAHRGEAGHKVIEGPCATMGACWPSAQRTPVLKSFAQQAVWDSNQPPDTTLQLLARAREPFAMAVMKPSGLFLARDLLGIRPLYYGRDEDGDICFASEVKALLGVAEEIHEFPPGKWYDHRRGFNALPVMPSRPVDRQSPESIAAELRRRLERAVAECMDSQETGAWLSGGLDSSAITALARRHVRVLHTFAAGFQGAPDLLYARQVADFLGTNHHSVVVTLDEVLGALPEVIYHLESFDALLVRSSVTNYLASKRACKYVSTVLSGEGADELFAGYSYLKDMDEDALPDELEDITQRLHNTALQRVDRSASAHGMTAHVPFLAPDVVDYARRIPAALKLRRSGRPVEKWILRKAVEDCLPESVVWRGKAKFWQGTGMIERLAHHAQQTISDADFASERVLPNGWTLNTKEELMYYRFFREQFGVRTDLSWMGRTKGSPVE